MARRDDGFAMSETLSIRRRYGARSSAARPARRGARVSCSPSTSPPALSLALAAGRRGRRSVRETPPQTERTSVLVPPRGHAGAPGDGGRGGAHPDEPGFRASDPSAAAARYRRPVRSNPRVSPHPRPSLPPPARRHADRRRRDATPRRGHFRVVRARARARVGGGGASLEGGGARAVLREFSAFAAATFGDVSDLYFHAPTNRIAANYTPTARLALERTRRKPKKGSGRAAQARPGGRRRFLR